MTKICTAGASGKRRSGAMRQPNDHGCGANRHPGRTALALMTACVGMLGCATTNVSVTPAAQPPVCSSESTALVLWATQWRPDQKDVLLRTAAAANGLQAFLQGSGCFARYELRQVEKLDPAALASRANETRGSFHKVVAIGVRELGPILKLGSSAALVEGGTEVVFHVSEQVLADPVVQREFTVHWRNGGPGVIKGVGTLAADLQAALAAGLQSLSAKR